ncbi:MAG TPA: UDP-N-acetylmuramoyl-L-alanyl-D-glutamate--2,6-diaminopimelate ligase [Candidatus Binatia bacterium]|nr:UDP-N-acetylmuramoyl-L-alanyl-D-glutamate--2,6-diaminopimelate ligase [Candidatus Binatia bacterium]
MRLREFLPLEEVDEAEGNLDQEVTGLKYDSRAVKAGDIFFAIAGEKVDGHEFIPQALQSGAAGVVVAQKGAWPLGTTWIRTKNVRHTMGLWGAHFYGRPSQRLRTVGVTGTNGKTTVSYLVESILSAAGLEPGVIGTINHRYPGRQVRSHHTTPESLDLQSLLAEMARAGARSVVMEVSSHALVQERVRGIDFDIALFTNLSRDHLDYHASMEDYFSAKSKLFTDYLKASVKPKKAAVIYGGDARGKELLQKVRNLGLEALGYGEDKEWDIHPVKVQSDVGGLKGQLAFKSRCLDFSSRLMGRANLQNIMGAVGVGGCLGLPIDVIAKGIQQLSFVPGRLERVENHLGVTVLVDYAHTPDALEKVLEAIRPLTQCRILTVFGCGGDRDRGKRPLMGEIAARLSDLVVLTSDNPRTEEPLGILAEIEEGLRKTGLRKFEQAIPEAQRGYWVEADRRAAIRLALRAARRGDAVLIAGKGHEDYQILGAKKVHFDDREVARDELRRIASA